MYDLFYRDSALQRRMKEREKEMETDERDRQKEKQEITEIRRRLQEEGDPDIEQHIARVSIESEVGVNLIFTYVMRY